MKEIAYLGIVLPVCVWALCDEHHFIGLLFGIFGVIIQTFIGGGLVIRIIPAVVSIV